MYIYVCLVVLCVCVMKMLQNLYLIYLKRV
jgi:hypothetical protein